MASEASTPWHSYLQQLEGSAPVGFADIFPSLLDRCVNDWIESEKKMEPSK